MTGEETEEILEKVSVQLSEHFDAVQIMVSWNEDGLTKCCKRGNGNWYARQGMAHEFIGVDQAMIQANEIAGVIHPDDNE